jgi:hypothetical protein
MNRLRPVVFFPPVPPVGSAPVGRLDRLAVHPQGLGGRRSPGLDADLLPESGVNLLPGAVQPPVPELAVNGLPGREVVGQHPPRPAGPQVVEDGVHHVPEAGGRRSPALAGAGLGLREQRFQPLPLVIGQVGRVGLPAHAQDN